MKALFLDALWGWNVTRLTLGFVIVLVHQEDGDLESYLTSVQEEMMEFKLSYEMWRVGHWAVSVPHVSHKSHTSHWNATTAQYESEFCEDMSLVVLWSNNDCARMVCKVRCYCLQMERENEEMCFTVHLEERDNPENLHWDVKKTQTDIIHFRNLWQVRDGWRGSAVGVLCCAVVKTDCCKSLECIRYCTV